MTKCEKSSDYAFFFKAVSKAYNLVTGEIYRPTCLVADTAGSITRGFESAFAYTESSEYSRVYCWQHVKRRILENYRSIKDNKKKSIQRRAFSRYIRIAAFKIKKIV